MADAVASPLEKLWTVRQAHLEAGKAFDERVWRAEIDRQYREKGWSDDRLLGESGSPEYIPASPEYARRVRMEDREAVAELERAKAATRAQVAQSSENAILGAMKDARIAELEAQVRELMQEPVQAPAPSPLPASTDPMANTIGGDRPHPGWTKAMVMQWASEHGIPVAEGFGGTKAELIDAVLAAADTGGEPTKDELPNV